MTILAALLVWGSAMMLAEQIPPPETDAGLKVTDGSKPLLRASAKGVQIYTCRDGAYDAAHSEPDAVLTNRKGVVIIHHYLNSDPAGPAWEATDGSKVIAKKLDPAQSRTGTIPWLRLEVVGHEGTGLLGKVTFIQRVDTAGGVAPAGTCDPAKSPRVRVPYTATYYFYGKTN